MTVKQLREYLADIPGGYNVFFEYDGPETFTFLPANNLYISNSLQRVVLESAVIVPETPKGQD